MNCKILIIGGTGTLSIDVVKLSLSKGHQVYILNRGNNVKSIPKSVKLLKADIKNPKEEVALYFRSVKALVPDNPVG